MISWDRERSRLRVLTLRVLAAVDDLHTVVGIPLFDNCSTHAPTHSCTYTPVHQSLVDLQGTRRLGSRETGGGDLCEGWRHVMRRWTRPVRSRVSWPSPLANEKGVAWPPRSRSPRSAVRNADPDSPESNRMRLETVLLTLRASACVQTTVGLWVRGKHREAGREGCLRPLDQLDASDLCGAPLYHHGLIGEASAHCLGSPPIDL